MPLKALHQPVRGLFHEQDAFAIRANELFYFNFIHTA
jgi:hypothetical protein